MRMLQLPPMSTFTYLVRVANPRGNAPPIEVKCLVDTGAMFTCLPRPDLEALGLTPQWRAPVKLAGGRREEPRGIWILMTICGRMLRPTWLFGPANGWKLLRALSVRQLALCNHPPPRKLVP